MIEEIKNAQKCAEVDIVSNHIKQTRKIYTHSQAVQRDVPIIRFYDS